MPRRCEELATKQSKSIFIRIIDLDCFADARNDELQFISRAKSFTIVNPIRPTKKIKPNWFIIDLK